MVRLFIQFDHSFVGGFQIVYKENRTSFQQFIPLWKDCSLQFEKYLVVNVANL